MYQQSFTRYPMLPETIKIVESTIAKFGDDVVVRYSGGKDSEIVLNLARQFNYNIRAVYSKTPQPKESYNHVLETSEKNKVNLVILEPYKGMDYWKCVDKYGLPSFRTSKKGKPHSPKCCYYIKEKPMMNYIKDNNIKAVITGLTAAESWNRQKTAYRYETGTWRGGLKKETIEDYERMMEEISWDFCMMRYYAKTWKSWQVHPIMAWTEADVWNYIKDYELPVNPMYQLWGGVHKRVGCLPCTAYLSWEKNLSASHPKLYKMLKDIQEKEMNQ